MSDLEQVRDMLARANMRYSIMSAPGQAIILVQGHRNESPMRASQVELHFDGDGALVSMEGRA